MKSKVKGQNLKADTDTKSKVKSQALTIDTVTALTAPYNPADTADTTWVIPTVKYRMPGKDTAFGNSKVQTPNSKGEATSKGKKGKNAGLVKADSTQADTTAPLFFIGYHHVKIFSDSLQAKCDSVCYTRSDSLIRLIYSPIAWSRKSQITGDTILMKMDSSQIQYLYVPNNAFVVSQSGPEKAKLFDQVQGKTLTAYFDKNEITHMIVFPSAEQIYYTKDEAGAYMGVDEAKSDKMFVYFDEQQIDKIKYGKNVEHTLSPMDKVDIPNLKLSRFKWLIDQRPKNKEELFE